jgi:membrane protein implicated in regulation of membrane protease activity
LESASNEAPFKGMVLVAGELWRAQADEAMDIGEVVMVTAVEGFTLHIKRASS